MVSLDKDSLSAQDLKDFYLGNDYGSSFSLVYLRDALKQFSRQMPDDITIDTYPTFAPKYYIRKSAVDKFFTLFKLKTRDWFDAKQIRSDLLVFSLSEKTIADILTRLQPQMPDDIQFKVIRDHTTGYCLRKSAIGKFVELANIQTAEWKNAHELHRLDPLRYTHSETYIDYLLRDLAPLMPNDIQPKLTRDGTTELCLRATAIDIIIDMLDNRKSEWLNPSKLKYGTYDLPSAFSLDLIANKLKELQSKMPYDIRPKLTRDGTTELCVRDTARDKFLELSNLLTFNWILPQELKATIPTSLIADKFKELQPKMPNDIQPKLLPNGTTELCLRKSAINKFLELGKIPTHEWLLPWVLEHATSVNASVIANKLQELQPKMPNDIQQKLTANGKTELCVRDTAWDKFLELADIQTDNWVTVRELKYGPYNIPSSFSLDVIADKLKDLQSKMPNDIKMKYTHHSTQELCLRTSQVSIFITNLFKSGSQPNDFATNITDDQMDEIASRLAAQDIAPRNADNVLLAELHKVAKSNQEPKRKKSVFGQGASAVSTLNEVNDTRQEIIRANNKQRTENK